MVKVSIHKFINNVDIIEGVVTDRLHDILHCDYVFMEQMAEQSDLSKCAPCICCVLKRIGDFLDCNFVTIIIVSCRAYNTICSFTYWLYGDILGVDLKQASPQHVVVFAWWACAFSYLDSACHFSSCREAPRSFAFTANPFFLLLLSSLSRRNLSRLQFHFHLCSWSFPLIMTRSLPPPEDTGSHKLPPLPSQELKT